jgi:predicted exporter
MTLFRFRPWSIALRLKVWLALLFVVVLAGGHLVVREQPVLQTNLLALLPKTERNPVAEQALESLSKFSENRVFFLIGASDAGLAIEQTRRFAAQLGGSSLFSNVTVDMPSDGFKNVEDWFLAHRFHLGFPEGLAKPSSNPEEALVQALQARLYSPMFGAGGSVSIQQDPFGFSQAWFDRLPTRSLTLVPQQGVLTTQGQGKTWVFLVATVQGSVYDQALASAAVAQVHQAESVLKAVEVIRVGALFYAEVARSKAQSDVDLIGVGSLLGMLLMLYWVFRSPRPLLGAVVSVGFGVAWACVVCVAVYGHLHLITLVFGASLIGEAVDYSIQYFAAHLDAKDRWDALAYLKRLAPGLKVALGTSLLGYGALLFSPFVALSQIALFAMVGLLAAWVSVFLFLPWCLRAPVQHVTPAPSGFALRSLLWWKSKVSVRMCVFGSMGLLLFAGAGVLRLKGQDDVKLLISPDANLTQQETQFKTITGVSHSSQFFLVEGSSVEEVLQREEALVQVLQPLVQAGQLGAYQAVSTFVPSQQKQSEHTQQWAQAVFSPPERLSRALDQVGLQPQLADTFRTDFDRGQTHPPDLNGWLNRSVSHPWRHLWLGNTEHGYASTVIPVGLAPALNGAEVAHGLPGISWVDKPASVSRLFQQYRQYSTYWLLGALGVVFCLLAYRYGLRTGFAVLLPTLLALSVALGVYGWLGHRVTLFNMMALMLVLGVGVNYSIFLIEGGDRSAITFVGVQLSAATTFLSFGLLSFSSMPVLAGFGLMLTVGIASAMLLSPMSLCLARNSKGAM